jgi:AcrR family transcriptional regulator
MSRWEPNSRGRLELAALELFIEQGFERTTVAEIAARAGLAERSFWRHFADKREVMFWGYHELEEHFAVSLSKAWGDLTPMGAVVAAFEVAAAGFPDRPGFSRDRDDLIAATPELQERELRKLAGIAGVITDALRGHGLPAPTAGLTAEAGVVIFKVAYQRWIGRDDDRNFPTYIRLTFEDLRTVVGIRKAPGLPT